MLREKILKKESGLIFYSLTPPKKTTDVEKIKIIADKQMERLRDYEIDGLLLYDIQDESERTDKERPFAFIPTLSPEFYADHYLNDLKIPKIIYKSIANMTREKFLEWIQSTGNMEYAVFVGASSHQQIQATDFSLNDAYEIKKQNRASFLLGGITIPERHAIKGDEHQRICNKADKGCSFFISQCVYSVNNTKNLLSDYYYSTIANGLEFSPMIFTLAPCGSIKTLHFMEWLGIDVPKWLYNDLKHSKDILEKSVNTCINVALEITDYATAKNIPIGFNIESVSLKKEEIEASHELLKAIMKLS